MDLQEEGGEKKELDEEETNVNEDFPITLHGAVSVSQITQRGAIN